MDVAKYVELVGDKILIKEDKFDSTTSSGLKFIKTDDTKSVGEVVLNNVHSSIFEIGYKVAYPKFAGVNVEICGEKFKTLEASEIFFTYNDSNIVAVNGYVVVKPIKKTKVGGLKTVKSEDNSNHNGIVVSVSPNPQFAELGIGDEAVYSKYSGFQVSISGEDHLVLLEKEVFFINKINKDS